MFRFALFVIMAFYSFQSVYACFSYARLFAYPSYVEIDDIRLANTNRLYQDNLFDMIVENMQLKLNKPQSSGDNESDSKYRELSKKSEADFYARYVQAADQYNHQDYAQALATFTKLHDSIQNKNSWVREASAYMIAFCQRNLAMYKWDGYSDPVSQVDQAMLQNAKLNYQKYLIEYPHGLYANSAKNIQRNLMFLSGQRDALNQAIKLNFSDKANINNKTLVDELRNFYTGQTDFENDPPILIAYEIIYHAKADTHMAKILDKRKADFIAYPDVYDFLKALTLYRLKDYAGVLRQLPENTVQNTPISLSVAYLRSQAQIHLNQEQNALATLLKMYAVSPQDAILKHIGSLELNNGHGLWLFSKEAAAIRNQSALQLFAKYGLSDSELESGLSRSDILKPERLILADELASRYLLSKNFQHLQQLLAQFPEIQGYNSIRSDIDTLIKDPNNILANLSVGGFIYETYRYPNIKTHEPSNHYSDELLELKECAQCQLFTDRMKNYTAPLTYFSVALNAIQKSNQTSDDEARALHYLIKCKRQAEFNERCTWNQEKINYDGKVYFDLLHRKYKDSKWAKATPYWYG